MTTPVCHIWEYVPHHDTTQERMAIAFDNLALTLQSRPFFVGPGESGKLLTAEESHHCSAQSDGQGNIPLQT